MDKPWQIMTDPDLAQVAAVFLSPPPEYSAQFTWGWRGRVDHASIVRDLDGMKALGVQAAIIDPASGMRDPYLSPGYFDLVRYAVEQAKQRNLRLWIMDDGDYPSGMAGGKFTMDRPDLRMEALGEPERFTVAGGTTFSAQVGSNVICAVAMDLANRTVRALDIRSGKINWTAPPGHWEVVLSHRVFRSGPTRCANNPTGAKDHTFSLMDYLNPAADEQFRQWAFESYQRVIGDELGKTVLGFRGDEPAFGFNPWTPKFLAEFQRRKGYDLRPYLGDFVNGRARDEYTDEERRAYADYCDVWSDLFRDNYFDMEAQWCADHGMEMQLHIEHEEILPQLAVADGDYFKCFRDIQVPGIDIIWHQIWMDNPADFPKLASSAAHLFGHPRAMCEAFAAYRPPPDLEQALWLLNFLMVHGINRIEYMYWPSSVARSAGGAFTNRVFAGNRYYRDPRFPSVAAYVNRLCYLLGEGRPAAQIGLYIPSSSFWLANRRPSADLNSNFLAVAHELIQDQRDFDFVDEQALSSGLKLKGDRLVNLSGQSYRAIIVPPAAAISLKALDTLRAFAKNGGTVIFLGHAPDRVVNRAFLHAKGPADISWCSLLEPTVAVIPTVLTHLPVPDFAADQPEPRVSYNHRRLRNADVYFIFNSGDRKATFQATLAGTGPVRLWDGYTGKIRPLAGTSAVRGAVRVPLDLDAGGTALVVVGP